MKAIEPMMSSSATSLVKLNSPLSRISRPSTAFKRSETTVCTPTASINPLNNFYNPSSPKIEIITEAVHGQNGSATPQRTEESPSSEKIAEPGSVPEGRKIELRHTVNLRFTRLMDSAIDHFSYKNRQEGEGTKTNFFDERKSESESFDEANETIDRDEFLRKKREVLDLRREIGARAKHATEQQQAILKLLFDINSLKVRVQNPASVKARYKNEVERLEREIEIGKIAAKRAMDMYVKEKNENEIAHRSFIYVLQSLLKKKDVEMQKSIAKEFEEATMVRTSYLTIQKSKTVSRIQLRNGSARDEVQSEIRRMKDELARKEQEIKELRNVLEGNVKENDKEEKTKGRRGTVKSSGAEPENFTMGIKPRLNNRAGTIKIVQSLANLRKETTAVTGGNMKPTMLQRSGTKVISSHAAKRQIKI